MFTTYFDGPTGGTTCWRYEHDYTDLNILSDKYFDGNEKSVEITLIPFFSGSKYLVNLYQQSLSAKAYEYWELVKQQISSSGGILDPPPSRIHGNLFCPSDPSKNVLGYFGASGMIKIAYLIDRSHSGPVNPHELREYPRNVACWELSNSYAVDPNPATWPEGWH
jgi:hypothetical protein